MFVFSSTYRELQERLEHAEQMLRDVKEQRDTYRKGVNDLYNDCVALSRKLEDSQNSQFSDKEIRTLISLCHPDKHGGRQVAVEITQKLTTMRK